MYNIKRTEYGQASPSCAVLSCGSRDIVSGWSPAQGVLPNVVLIIILEVTLNCNRSQGRIYIAYDDEDERMDKYNLKLNLK
jgi:hypothetical protein